MRMWPISTRVNKPENDDSSIVEPTELDLCNYLLGSIVKRSASKAGSAERPRVLRNSQCSV